MHSDGNWERVTEPQVHSDSDVYREKAHQAMRVFWFSTFTAVMLVFVCYLLPVNENVFASFCVCTFSASIGVNVYCLARKYVNLNKADELEEEELRRKCEL